MLCLHSGKLTFVFFSETIHLTYYYYYYYYYKGRKVGELRAKAKLMAGSRACRQISAAHTPLDGIDIFLLKRLP